MPLLLPPCSESALSWASSGVSPTRRGTPWFPQTRPTEISHLSADLPADADAQEPVRRRRRPPPVWQAGHGEARAHSPGPDEAALEHLEDGDALCILEDVWRDGRLLGDLGDNALELGGLGDLVEIPRSALETGG